MDPELREYLDKLSESLTKSHEETRSDLKALKTLLQGPTRKLDELSDPKSAVKELEITHDNVADDLIPAEETTDIVPDLAASAASAKPLAIDTPTSCSTDGLSHNAYGDDPMVACQAAWSTPTSFTVPPGDSPTSSREPALGLAIGALAHTKYSTEGSEASANSMVLASTSGAARSAAVTTVLPVDIQPDTTESLEVVPVITNSNSLGVELRPLPWPSFEGNRGRTLRVRRVPSLKERRSQKQWSMLAYWGILELTHVILHNPCTSIFDPVLQCEFGGHTSMGIASRIQLPVLLTLGHCSLFWTTILAGHKHHLQVVQIIATLLSILPGPGIHLPSYTQHGKYLPFFQPKPPRPHPQVVYMRLSLDVAESGCCYSAILASGEPPMCLEYEKLLHWLWGGAIGITSWATTLFLAQIFAVYLNIGVIKLTQPCMVQLLTVRANCSILSDYQTVQLFSCKLPTGWPSVLIITEVSWYAPLRNANQLLGADISIWQQQQKSVKLCLFSEMSLVCNLAAIVLKRDGIQGSWLGGFFLFAQSNSSKDIIHVHAANDGDALFVTGHLSAQHLLHQWWIFNYQRRFQEVFTVADHPQATLNSLLSGGASVFQLWPPDRTNYLVRQSNSLLNSAETNAEQLPDPSVVIQPCWSSLSCASYHRIELRPIPWPSWKLQFLIFKVLKCFGAFSTSVAACSASAMLRAAFSDHVHLGYGYYFDEAHYSDQVYTDLSQYHEDYHGDPSKTKELYTPCDPSVSALRSLSKIRLGGKPSLNEGGVLEVACSQEMMIFFHGRCRYRCRCFDHAYYYSDQVHVGHHYYLGTLIERVPSGYDYYIDDACFFDLRQVHLNHGYYRDDYPSDSGMSRIFKPPDPGEFFVATAWGQAVFQEGRGVSDPPAARPSDSHRDQGPAHHQLPAAHDLYIRQGKPTKGHPG